MTIRVKPPPKYQSQEPDLDLPDSIEEAPQPSSVASSFADLRPKNNIRYRTEPIAGLLKPVRFRSLTAKEFLEVREREGVELLLEMLKLSICDDQGRRFLSDEDIKMIRTEDYDGRTFQQLVRVAEEHSFVGTDLADAIEDAEKNSQPTVSSATS